MEIKPEICLEEGKKLERVIMRYKEVVIYLIFGALTTAVSLLTYFLSTSLILDVEDALQLQLANVISWLVSVTFAYITNKRFVFQSENVIVKEIGKFYLSRLGTLLMDMSFMHLLVTVARLDDVLAKTVTQVVVIISNYLLGKFLVFKEEKYE